MINVVTQIALTVLTLAILLSLWRVVRGPTLPDRVVALDLVGVLIAALAVVSAARTGERYFLDIALIIALISFIGTVAYARYIEAAEKT